jgi:hypothetical protein
LPAFNVKRTTVPLRVALSPPIVVNGEVEAAGVLLDPVIVGLWCRLVGVGAVQAGHGCTGSEPLIVNPSGMGDFVLLRLLVPGAHR